uniref:Uncharacterized protein n=1 Tax=Spongospora subterranea TaxID=70186 RepID=A0A0H5R402_9EUKA|eukprot:CRZ08863.1 hypothetical protein [Spongospora subterranea]
MDAMMSSKIHVIILFLSIFCYDAHCGESADDSASGSTAAELISNEIVASVPDPSEPVIVGEAPELISVQGIDSLISAFVSDDVEIIRSLSPDEWASLFEVLRPFGFNAEEIADLLRTARAFGNSVNQSSNSGQGLLNNALFNEYWRVPEDRNQHESIDNVPIDPFDSDESDAEELHEKNLRARLVEGR